MINDDFALHVNRRAFLGRGAAGLGMVALNSLVKKRNWKLNGSGSNCTKTNWSPRIARAPCDCWMKMMSGSAAFQRRADC